MTAEKKIGVVYPAAYRVTVLYPSAIVLPSTVIAYPRAVWQWVADEKVSWVVVTTERSWKASLPSAPRYTATPTWIGHLYYGDVYAFYAPRPDDLAMLPYAMDGRWWPEACVDCGGELDGYDDWGHPRCTAHPSTSPTLIGARQP